MFMILKTVFSTDVTFAILLQDKQCREYQNLTFFKLDKRVTTRFYTLLKFEGYCCESGIPIFKWRVS